MRFATFFMIIFIGTFTVWASQSAAQEEIYRWVDDKGVVHFGDRPPQQADVEKISIPESQIQPSEGSDPVDQEASQSPQPNLAQQLREERAEARKKREANAEVTVESCAKARELVSQLEPSTRVIVEYEDGTVTRLDDNERLDTLGKAKTFIAENCDK